MTRSPFCLRQVEQGLPGLHAGIVDHDVQRAKLRIHAREHGVHLGRIADIGLHGEGASPRFDNLSDGAVGSRRVAVIVHGYGGALSGQFERNALADPLTCACDERKLVLKRSLHETDSTPATVVTNLRRESCCPRVHFYSHLEVREGCTQN